jgi:hypothetical protein
MQPCCLTGQVIALRGVRSGCGSLDVEIGSRDQVAVLLV